MNMNQESVLPKEKSVQNLNNISNNELQHSKPKKKQMPLEFFVSPMKHKHKNDSGDDNKEKITKKPKIEVVIINDDNKTNEKHLKLKESDKVIPNIDYSDEKLMESEEKVDEEILAFATSDDENCLHNHQYNNTEDKDKSDNPNTNNISLNTTTEFSNNSKSVIRSLDREKQLAKNRTQKQIEEEKKREARRLKKIQDEERRREKKAKEEEERRIKREKIELERKAKREQKEAEKLEKQKKREEEIKLREEKKIKEEEEKQKRKEEVERKRQQKILEKQKIEEEKELKRVEEEEKKKKRSITNFFKIKSSSPISDGSKLDTNSANSTNDSDDNKLKESFSNDNKSEFLQYFLPFHVKPNVQLVQNINNKISNKWDEFIKAPNSFTIPEESEIPVAKSLPLNNKIVRAIDVLQCLNAGSINEANRLFNNVPLKYLKFYENKRSFYLGTFSYTLSDIKEQNINLKLYPYSKITINRINNNTEETDQLGPVINYDYDSDIDDEEDGEEGEDIDSADEDEEDEDEIDSSDIDEFVEKDMTISNEDDNEINVVKNKHIMGPLIPLVRNNKENIAQDDEFGNYFTTLQWERMHEKIEFPIDPFKDYWSDNSKPERKDQTKSQKEKEDKSNPLIVSNTNLIKADILGNATDVSYNSSNINAKTTESAAPLVVKKKVISNVDHLRILIEFIKCHKSLSLNTLAELAVKDEANKGVLGDYSRAVVKNSVKANASFDKKTGSWIVKKLEASSPIDEMVKKDDVKHVTG